MAYKRAVITGADGQDGSYLAEILLERGYDVWGLVRPGTHPLKNITSQIKHHKNFLLTIGDVNSIDTINDLVGIHPDEFYHLAALSHVGDSFKHPVLTNMTNFVSTQRILDKLKNTSTRFYFAGSSETLAETHGGNPNTPYSAHSPYAISKAASQMLVKIYRTAYKMYAVNGIAFNHESRRRGPNFVTRKIALGVRNYIKTGEPVYLGNFLARRDWHHAYDTMMGAWLSLQQPHAYDYVFASGTDRSVFDFAVAVCDHLGAKVEDAVRWDEKVEQRPLDVHLLRGDPRRAEEALKWERKYDFAALVEDVCHE